MNSSPAAALSVGSKESVIPKKSKQTMKTTNLLATLLCFGGLIFYSAGCKNKTNNTPIDNSQTNQSDTPQKVDPANNPYNGLRQLALNAETSEIKEFKARNPDKVYGIVMDWDVGSGIATLVAFESGEASLYLSSGGGLIGGGRHENVKKSTEQFISLSQTMLANTTKVDTALLPDKDCVKFYLLTSKGKFVAQEKMGNIENKISKWLPLFEEGNKVISELRIASENTQIP
jgi:hypothetical protein